MIIILILSGIILIAGFLLILVGTSMFDISHAKRMRQAQRKAKTSQFKTRPQMTIYLYSANNSRGLKATLSNLATVTYKKLQVIVVDVASKDDSRSVARQFIRDRPKRFTRLVAQRKVRTLQDSMRAAITKSAKTELVLILHAGDMFDTDQSLYRLIDTYNGMQAKSPIALATMPYAEPYVANLLARYASFLVQRAAKIAHICRALCVGSCQSGVLYPADKLVNDQTQPAVYEPFALRTAAKIQITTWRLKGISVFRRRLVVGLGVTIIGLLTISIGYSLYIAIELRQPTLLVVYCGVGALFVLHAVWNNQSTHALAKLRYTFALPVTLVPALGYGFARSMRLLIGFRRRLMRPL